MQPTGAATPGNARLISQPFVKSLLRLQLLHALSIALPIAIHPWLARHLEPAAYGRLIFVTAVISYFVLMCDFGFNWSATRLIASDRANGRRCSEVVSTTLSAKMLLFVGGMVLLWMLTVWIPEFAQMRALLLVAYGGVLGNVLSPSFYFQGMDKAHVALSVEVIARSLLLIAIVASVRHPDDLFLAISLSALGQFAAGLIGALLLIRERDLEWMRPSLRQITEHLRRGVPLFLSTSAVSLYSATSSLILGLISTVEQVAFFGAAQKVIAACSAIFQPFHLMFYPRINAERQRTPRRAVGLVLSALGLQLIVGVALSLVLLFFADVIVGVLFGEAFGSAVTVLRWMAVVPLFLAAATVFANYVMLPAGKDRLHLLMTVGAGLINVAIVLAIGAAEGALAAAIGIVVAEAFVLAFSLVAGGRLLREARGEAR